MDTEDKTNNKGCGEPVPPRVGGLYETPVNVGVYQVIQLLQFQKDRIRRFSKEEVKKLDKAIEMLKSVECKDRKIFISDYDGVLHKQLEHCIRVIESDVTRFYGRQKNKVIDELELEHLARGQIQVIKYQTGIRLSPQQFLEQLINHPRYRERLM